MLCVDVRSKKESVYLKLQMHQRIVEMIVLSAELEYKLKKRAKHGIVVKWLLSFEFITSTAKRRSSLWATQRDDIANLKHWNTKRIRDCVQLRHSSDTSSFLVEVDFKFFAFYSNCIPFLSLNASQKTQYLCRQEFGGIVTFAQTFLLFLRVCPKIQQQQKNWRRRSQENCPVPVQSKKRFYSQQLLIILKKQNALVLFPEKSILNFLSSTQINEMFFVFFSSHWRAFSTSKRKLLRFVVFEQTFDHFRPNCSW